jgi:phosphoribosylaminoimidazolecarboxamide formyltransferase/IMP cyclohydrolase
MKNIKSALISVFDKEGLEPLIRILNDNGVIIYSTGGTEIFIKNLGIEVTSVESITDYPSILGGRVKTLHPKVFGGILNRREIDKDQIEINEYQIPEIDMVIVDLYPFSATAEDILSTHQEIIEKIDIGGVSLIRAGGKNYKDVFIVSNKNQYNQVCDMLISQNGSTTLEQRMNFAGESFELTNKYDYEIAKYFLKVTK